MKKVVSLLLAVVLVFSMATVALAATPKVCGTCGFETTDAKEYNDHHTAGGCGRCAHCGNGFETAEELSYHQHDVCRLYAGKATCDYCGAASESTEADFEVHVAACKAKYFNIPVAKIIAIVKDLISKIDFSAIIGTVKDKVVPAITGLVGKIDFSAIKLPA